MSSTITSFDPPERPGSQWFRDINGVPTTSKHKDEILLLTVDVSESVASGETVSSASWSDSGVTTSSRNTTSTTVYANVTGTNGGTTVTITLSTGRKLVRGFRFIDVPDGSQGTDYP